MPIGRLNTELKVRCRVCDTEFISVHYATKYCSKKCKHNKDNPKTLRKAIKYIRDLKAVKGE